MKKILAILMLFLTLEVYAQKNNNSFLSYTAKINLQVINVEKTQDEIIQFINKNNLGYFTNRDNFFIQVKINPEVLNNRSFISFLKEKGLIITEEITSYNYREDINTHEITIKTQEDALVKIFQIFDKAALYMALEFEKKIQESISAIENAKGQLRYIQEHIKYAYVDITFKSYTTLIKKSVDSPFDWINQLKIENLFKDF
jgi:hypothetical protein